jgi:hypothetical protein
LSYQSQLVGSDARFGPAQIGGRESWLTRLAKSATSGREWLARLKRVLSLRVHSLSV